jgi:hypothetical protein
MVNARFCRAACELYCFVRVTLTSTTENLRPVTTQDHELDVLINADNADAIIHGGSNNAAGYHTVARSLADPRSMVRVRANSSQVTFHRAFLEGEACFSRLGN